MIEITWSKMTKHEWSEYWDNIRGNLEGYGMDHRVFVCSSFALFEGEEEKLTELNAMLGIETKGMFKAQWKPSPT